MNETDIAKGGAVSERRRALLAAIHAGGGTWDWRRARQTYASPPEPHIIRRDLQELCKAGELGLYEAAAT